MFVYWFASVYVCACILKAHMWFAKVYGTCISMLKEDIIYLNLNQKCIINSNANESFACNNQLFLLNTENVKTFYDSFLDFRA